MSDLVLVTPVTEAELPAYREVFGLVQRNLGRAGLAADLVVVLQARGDAAHLDLDFLRIPHVDLVTTQRFSASAARNLGLMRIRRAEHRYVCFLDSDAVPSVGLLRSVAPRLSRNADLLVGRVRWYEGDLPDPGGEAAEPARAAIGRLLMSTYLWSSFLPVPFVVDSGVRFDESIGPGEATRLKSGEDVLFLAELVVANEVRHVLYFERCALHPERPADFSKHLTYAEGQGALFIRLLRTRMRRSLKATVLASFGLFLGNGLLRVLTLRRRSLRILGLRLRGAWRALRTV